MEAILALGGAFNPVHTQHIALMSLVKEVAQTRALRPRDRRH
jgi:nicotinic acid mononucleotide adenylyltransferase